jgi:hypothetical protein
MFFGKMEPLGVRQVARAAIAMDYLDRTGQSVRFNEVNQPHNSDSCGVENWRHLQLSPRGGIGEHLVGPGFEIAQFLRRRTDALSISAR